VNGCIISPYITDNQLIVPVPSYQSVVAINQVTIIRLHITLSSTDHITHTPIPTISSTQISRKTIDIHHGLQEMREGKLTPFHATKLTNPENIHPSRPRPISAIFIHQEDRREQATELQSEG
jgi:hypothetical protein